MWLSFSSRIIARVPRENSAFLGQCTLVVLLKKIEEETQFSRRAFFSIFNTQRREIARNASLVPSRIAYRGLHAGKGARKKGREMGRGRRCCASPGKIIVKTLVEERRGQPKGRINLDVSESRMVQQGCCNARVSVVEEGGREMCYSCTAPPFYFMLRFARKITTTLSRFPLRMHFKRLRTNRK